MMSTAIAAPILIINGASGTSEPGTTSAVTTNLSALHVAAGNSVTVSDAVPVSLAGFTQVWDVRFNPAITGAQQSQYISYLAGGGNMFVMGENSGFMTRNNSVLSLIQAAGGGSISFGGGSSLQTVNAPVNGPNAVSQVNYAAPGFVTSAGTGQFLTQAGSVGSALGFASGTLANAAAGSLAIVFDVNFMMGQFDQPASQNFTRNLIGYVAAGGNPGGGQVPEPNGVLLIGSILLMFALVVRMRSQAEAIR